MIKVLINFFPIQKKILVCNMILARICQIKQEQSLLYPLWNNTANANKRE